ncbi:DUF2339 domain-containing protein [Treponema sp. HNW]|uniref:DUF2339 domain-containing protein n=1 Tax=Treponema sp. HNW TaxID=3116654 RepID=UPI003D0A1E23
MDDFLISVTLISLLLAIVNTIRISVQKSRIKRLEAEIESLGRMQEKAQKNCDALIPAAESVDTPPPASAMTEDKAAAAVEGGAAAAVENPQIVSTQSRVASVKNGKPEHVSAVGTFIKKQLSIESIVTKLGILLLLIGIGYIFKLIHEKGFIREEYILLVGVLAGGFFTAAGFFVRHKKRFVLSQVLFGGAVAVFYLTAFAAYVRYGLIGDGLAFIFLSLITISAYVLALAFNSLSVSVIGLLGSLFIPFIIDSGFFGVGSFGLYVFAVALMSTIVYFFKRRRILQFASIISLLSVLTKLLLSSSFTVRDAQLFLALSAALWAIHTVPDLYVFLKGTELSRDKILSPIAAVINFGFSLFFGFKMMPYEALPPGSVYIFFTLLYALLSCLCLFKDKVQTLGYTYIAGTLISAYIAIIDRLQYDTEPAAVLGIGLFLYWLWRKDNKYKLHLFAHIISFTGFLMLIAALERTFNTDESPVHFSLQALLYFVPMAASVFLQKNAFKKGFQTLVFQVYVSVVLFALLLKILPRHFDDVCLLYGFSLTILCTLYTFVHYRFADFFYEKSLYVLPFLTALSFTLYGFENGEKALVPLLLQCAAGGAFAGFSFIKTQSARLRFANRLGFYLIVLKLCLVDFYFFSFVFAYPLFAAAVCILLADRFYPDFLTGAVRTKKISKAVWAILCVWYYALYAFARVDGLDPSFFMFAVNVWNGLILLYIVYGFKPRVVAFFAVVTAVFVFFSITETYLRFKNGGILTLLWGFYAIASFIFFLKKGMRLLVYIALVLILIVAAKLIFIDLHSVSVLSKAVTSSVFGAALLALSYAVQPMLKKFSSEKSVSGTEHRDGGL